MLQEENDVKDAVAASSSKLELGFHLKIHQIRCRKRIGNTYNEEIGARSVTIAIGISPTLLEATTSNSRQPGQPPRPGLHQQTKDAIAAP